MDSADIKKMFKLKWFLGEYIVLDGKRYSKNDIDPALFRNIQLKKVVFKAQVWVDGKHVDDIVIEYPSMAPLSGGESGWFVSGSSEWNQVFQKANVDQTIKLCEQDFEVRNPQLETLEFDGLDLIRSSLVKYDKRSSSDTADQVKAPPSQTVVRTYKKKKTKKRSRIGGYFRQIAVDYRTGRIKDFKGNAWFIGAESGLGFVRYPINVNTIQSSQTNGLVSYDSVSHREYGFGSGLSAGAEVWPMFGKFWGLGASGNVSFTWSPRSTITYMADAGVNGFLGSRPFHFLFGAGMGIRSVGYELEEGSVGTAQHRLVVGEDDFELNRFNFGIRTWLGERSKYIVDVVIHFEQPNYRKTGLASVWDISLWRVGSYKASALFSLEYPSPGAVSYEETPDYSDSGFWFAAKLVKRFDFFGRPYRFKRR
jgi:hypothetical protein